jgi:O-acetyl-ADP-ribose deacetylase (regulator of RNase III)
MPARCIIHTVGPVWRGGTAGEPDLLASCYRRSLELAEENAVSSVAFPAISTGAFGYPPEQATEIAVRTVVDFLAQHEIPRNVIFACFGPESTTLYRRVVARVTNTEFP